MALCFQVGLHSIYQLALLLAEYEMHLPIWRSKWMTTEGISKAEVEKSGCSDTVSEPSWAGP